MPFSLTGGGLVRAQALSWGAVWDKRMAQCLELSVVVVTQGRGGACLPAPRGASCLCCWAVELG